MLQKISLKITTFITLAILDLTMIFHALVLAGIIPYDIVWWGRLQSVEQMWIFETVTIVINMLLSVVVLLKSKILKLEVSESVLDSTLWIFFVLFSANTVGNLFAKTTLETLLFTPLTFLLALLCFRMWMWESKGEMLRP